MGVLANACESRAFSSFDEVRRDGVVLWETRSGRAMTDGLAIKSNPSVVAVVAETPHQLGGYRN